MTKLGFRLIVAALALAGVAGAVALWQPYEEEPEAFPACAPTEPAPSATSAPSVEAATSLVRPTLSSTIIVIPDLTSGSGQSIPLAGPDPALAVLQSTLAWELESTSVPGRFALTVTDLQTGATAHVNGDRPQRVACVMNLFAIILTLRDVQEGFYPLEEVDGIIRQTIWASDAAAARLLYRQAGNGDVVAGVRRVEQLQREVMGLEATVIDHPPAFGNESIGNGGDNLTTANEMNSVLAMLYAGDLLSADLTAYLLEAMTRVKPGLNYLTAALPARATVSHKNGFFPAWDGYVDNDTAIVRFGPNLEYAYAITFLSESVPEEYQEIWLAQHLVRMTWDYFESRYRFTAFGCSREEETSLWLGDLPPQLPRGLYPLLDAGLCVRQRFFVGAPVRHATRQLGHIDHKGLVFLAPPDDQLISHEFISRRSPYFQSIPRTCLT